jgi:hypothetical protein
MSNFSMYSGDSKKLSIYVRDEKGLPVDITGYTAEWTLIQRGSIQCTKSQGTGLSIPEPKEGRVDIRIRPEDTKGISGSARHSLVVSDPNGDVYTVLVGDVNLYTV